MAQKIPEPNIHQANLSDWEAFIMRTTAQMTGAMMLNLENMNGNGEPAISAGSRIEFNGALYWCQTTEGIREVGNKANNSVNYIYAIANGETCYFEYSSEAPTWNPALGGWYSGTVARAVAKFFYVGGRYNGKVILDGPNAMDKVNTKQPIETDVGYLIASGPVNGEQSVLLPPGAYFWGLKGGKGGKGGDSGYLSYYIPSNDVYGKEGQNGYEQNGKFFNLKPQEYTFSTGGNGKNGANGVVGGNWSYLGTGGGGGGGASGGMSYITEGSALMAYALGGAGGSGGTLGSATGGWGGIAICISNFINGGN
jgi:hypothetical protein